MSKKLYSNAYSDEVIIKEEHYELFIKKFRKSLNYDESVINDLIYYAYDIFEDLEYSIIKRRLLIKIADITNIIPVEKLMGLKHYELKKLLYVSIEDYTKTFNNLESQSYI